MITNDQTQHDNRVDDSDQDAEPTMMSPEEGRPDGMSALKGEPGTPGVTPTAPLNDERPETD